MQSGGEVPMEWRYTVSEVLIGSNNIAKRISELSAQLYLHYSTLNPLLIVVLKGSFMFAADLSRSLTFPHQLEFITAKSYSGTESTGTVQIQGLENAQLSDRHVIIVEDIVDTGLTLSRLYDTFAGAGAASIKCCSFLEKVTVRRKDSVPIIDYIAFRIPDKFVVGYGLDCDQKLRHLPFVGVFKK